MCPMFASSTVRLSWRPHVVRDWLRELADCVRKLVVLSIATWIPTWLSAMQRGRRRCSCLSSAPIALLSTMQSRFGRTGCPKAFPSKLNWQRLLIAMGVDLFNRGEIQAALNAFWPNFLLRLEIVRRHPSDREAIRDFASAEDLIGLACISLQKLATAEEMLSESLRYRRGLFEDDPSDAHAAFLYGVALSHFGRLERAKGDDVSAMTYYRHARDHLIEVDKAWPDVSFVELELADVVERMEAINR
jgi:hypothetical protein